MRGPGPVEIFPEENALPGEGLPARITGREFDDLRALIRRESGICIPPGKVALLVNRLAPRLRALGFRSFGEYYRHLLDPSSADERVRMLDRICTNETHFFREPRHFQYLEECPLRGEAPSAAPRRSPIRAWCAACSTGEEAYSLAMVLLSRLPEAWGCEARILATDLSTRALERAAEGIYSLERAREIPPRYLHEFMLKGTGARRGSMRVRDEVRERVEFRRLNLNDVRYPAAGPFDLIFCRNVLIYFDAETRRRVVDQLLRHLAPEGHLFVGSAESLGSVTDAVRLVLPAVYVHAAPPGQPPGAAGLPRSGAGGGAP